MPCHLISNVHECIISDNLFFNVPYPIVSF